MTIQTARAIVEPHRAAELERARAGIEADVEWCRWRRKYGHVGTLAEARAGIRDYFHSIDSDLSSEQQQTNNTTPATAKASATTTTE